MAVETGISFSINPRFVYLDFGNPINPALSALGKDGAVYRYLGSATRILQSVGWDVITAEQIREVLADVKKGVAGSVNRYQELMPKALSLAEQGNPQIHGKVVFGVDASLNNELEIEYNPRAYGIWLRVGEVPEEGNPFQTMDELIKRLSNNSNVGAVATGKTPWREDIVEFETDEMYHRIIPIRVTQEAKDLRQARKISAEYASRTAKPDGHVYFPLVHPEEKAAKRYFLPE